MRLGTNCATFPKEKEIGRKDNKKNKKEILASQTAVFVCQWVVLACGRLALLYGFQLAAKG